MSVLTQDLLTSFLPNINGLKRLKLKKSVVNVTSLAPTIIYGVSVEMFILNSTNQDRCHIRPLNFLLEVKKQQSGQDEIKAQLIISISV